jgi:hypothetical protein
MVKMEEKINLPALCGAIGWESALPLAKTLCQRALFERVRDG